MKIYTQEDFTRQLTRLAENTNTIDIITYGMYAGISHHGDYRLKHQNSTADLFNMLTKHNTKTRIIVGIYSFISCTRDHICPDCLSNYVGKFESMRLTVESYPHLNIRFTTEMHAKLYITDKEYILGSKNLSDSSWDDLFVKGKTTKRVHGIFTDIWNRTGTIEEEYQRVVAPILKKYNEENALSPQGALIINHTP